jgi:hypothetical protein
VTKKDVISKACPTLTEVELKPSRKSSATTAAGEPTIIMEMVLLATASSKWVESAPATTSTHLVQILSSVISYTLVFITEHLHTHSIHIHIVEKQHLSHEPDSNFLWLCFFKYVPFFC